MIAASDTPGDGQPFVIVVDDDEPVRDVVATMTRELGFVVFEASCGEEALQILNTAGVPIGVLITDIDMPGMNGFNLADAFRQRSPATRIVYMSGVPLPDIDRRYCETRGPFLEKPIDIEALTLALRAALGR